MTGETGAYSKKGAPAYRPERLRARAAIERAFHRKASRKKTRARAAIERAFRAQVVKYPLTMPGEQAQVVKYPLTMPGDPGAKE